MAKRRLQKESLRVVRSTSCSPVRISDPAVVVQRSLSFGVPHAPFDGSWKLPVLSPSFRDCSDGEDSESWIEVRRRRRRGMTLILDDLSPGSPTSVSVPVDCGSPFKKNQFQKV